MRNLARQVQVSANQIAADIAWVQANPYDDKKKKKEEQIHWAMLHIIGLVKELEKKLRENSNEQDR